MKFKKFLDDKKIKYAWVKDAMFVCEWDSRREDRVEIRKTIDTFLNQYGLKNDLKLTGVSNTNIKGKDVDFLMKEGFEPISELEYIEKFW